MSYSMTHHRTLRRYTFLLLLSLGGLNLSACGAPEKEDPANGDGDGGPSGDGDGGPSGDGDGGPSGDGDGGPSGDGDGGPSGDGDGDGDGDGSTGMQPNLGEVAQSCEGPSQVGPAVLRRLTRNETTASLRDIFDLNDSWVAKLSADPASKLGFSTDAATLVVGGATAREMLKTAEDVGDLVVAQLSSVLPCSSSAADRACAVQFVQSYGRRLFRRPPSDEEVSRYADYQQSVAGRSDFSTGMKWMITSMVQSPHAFYRSEIGEASATGRQLDNFEMATELAYMFTGTTPDETLLARAEAGELSDPATRVTEAERLLSTHPDQHEGVRGFFAEWLNYRTVLGKSRVDVQNFADQISTKMVQETESFVNTVVFDERGTIDDLMTAPYTTVDRSLSEFYGFGNVATDTFERVDKPAVHGSGILSQGSILAMTSHQDATSPTLRGLLVSEKFFCQERPLPPAGIPTLEETNEGIDAKTTREKYEINHAAGGTTCRTCHLRFEPFGYLFEHYDETGRYRADEDGEIINTAADNIPLPGGEKMAMADLHDLTQFVGTNTEIQSCISGLLEAYMFSGAGGVNCLSAEARNSAIAGEIGIYDLLKSYVEAPHFSQRK